MTSGKICFTLIFNTTANKNELKNSIIKVMARENHSEAHTLFIFYYEILYSLALFYEILRGMINTK